MILEIRNAIIKTVTISNADHGVLSSFLHLDYGGQGQGFGGYAMFSPGYPDVTGLWIWRCMEIAGVSRWEDIPGRPIRVKSSHSSVESIGHILEDIWFTPREEFSK